MDNKENDMRIMIECVSNGYVVSTYSYGGDSKGVCKNKEEIIGYICKIIIENIK